MTFSRRDHASAFLFAGAETERSTTLRQRLRTLDGVLDGHVASTADEALAVVERERPAVVVARADLPDGDGFDVLRRIRDDHPGTRTLLLATNPSASVVERAYDAGVDEVVQDTGPESDHIVERHVARFLRARDATADPTPARQMAALAETAADAVVTVDESGTIRSANSAESELFGYDPVALVGEPVTTLLPDDDGQQTNGRSATDGRALDGDVELLSFEGDTTPPARRVAAGETVDGELRIAVGGETRRLSVASAPLPDDGATRSTVVTFQDVTDRERRERRLRLHDAVMNTVGDGLYALDEDGRFVVVNDAYADLVGTDREALLGRPADEVVGEHATAEAADLQRRILDDDVEEATLETWLATVDGERVPIEARISLFELDDDTTGRAGVVRDVSDRQRREDRLARLNEVGQALTVAETRAEVADVVVEGGREVLGLPLATVEYYDETTGRLASGPRTDELEALVGTDPLFTDEWDLPWQVYAENEARVVADLDGAADVGETPLGSAIVLPLGSHGVFVAGASTAGAFTETEVKVARILAANALASLDRVDRERELRSERARLQEHNESLERINRLNGVIRRLTRKLTQASTREAVETALCEELASVEPYTFAWVGERQAVGDEVVPRASAGRDAGYLDAVTVTADEGPNGHAPTGVALRTHDPAVQNDLHTDPPFEPWRSEALQRGFRSSIAVPLVYRETVYGVLNLYAGEPDVFDEMEVAVLGELGSMVGYALNAIERKKALVSDSAVELTFAVDDPALPSVRFAAETGGEFTFETLVEQSDGSFRVFFAVAGVDPPTVYEFAERSPIVEHVSLLTEHGDTGRYEAVVSDDSFLGDLVSYGAHPTALTADADGGRVTVELPRSGDVQSFIRMFVGTYEGATLLARTEHDRPIRTSAEFEADYRDRLTERQTEVLKTAYFSGFFEWPRVTSGKELAAMLDIAQPTVSRHLRSGERKLFGLVFDDD
ncbi:bacterio-opsin activator domain-containing protein [Halomarina rubra]|uniref:Bacterio-opsin activator domain-containing protein n=1 Tax=Halomarina rubra TaxID=2071873 RepID=A0ABD6AW73_9EURY